MTQKSKSKMNRRLFKLGDIVSSITGIKIFITLKQSQVWETRRNGCKKRQLGM